MVGDFSQDTKLVLRSRLPTVFENVLKALGQEGHDLTSGHLRIYAATDEDAYKGPVGWHEVFESTVGFQLSEREWEGFRRLSESGAVRLMKNNARMDHWSAWQSRQAYAYEYGGAIMVSACVPELASQVVRILLSFTGLTEEGNEAVACLMVEGMRWGSLQHEDHLQVSNNNLARKLLVNPPVLV